ncbi:MAG: hypothetical protein CVU11_16515 [Bacteroidetes bacterium HGW-Bacteroidetes-6]|jgi:carbon monoxide dehydrogenase subunit G|nr:MAG: hypothetical protein CVU11_16515 [Bacteroidetes bacterium HGW-Bacteroidetes-6]
MAEFESKKVTLNTNQETVFGFLSDFRNFDRLVDGKVKDWQATADFCSFSAEGAGLVKLRYKTRSHNLIEIEPDMSLPVSGELILFVELKNMGEKTEATVGANVSIPPMFRMMLSRPLKNMLEMIAGALENYYNG